MRYSITIMEFKNNSEAHARDTWHYFDNLTLKQAWQIAERHARRGFNRFGGSIDKSNWGLRGGSFPHAYRSAIIRADI
jgi:hypothetical protein